MRAGGDVRIQARRDRRSELKVVCAQQFESCDARDSFPHMIAFNFGFNLNYGLGFRACFSFKESSTHIHESNIKDSNTLKWHLHT